MENFNKYLRFIASSFAVIFISIMALGLPLQYLWNDVVPTLFGLRRITFGEAVELNLLAHILFGLVGSPIKILFNKVVQIQ